MIQKLKYIVKRFLLTHFFCNEIRPFSIGAGEHDKTSKWCSPSEDSDKPGHPQSRQQITKELNRPCTCTAWPMSLMLAYGINWFYNYTAHFSSTTSWIEYKNLSWLWGAHWKFHQEHNCSASWGLAVIPSDGIFNSLRTAITDSFSCILFLRQLHLGLNMCCFISSPSV